MTCPGCHRSTYADACIGDWHAGCAPKDVRDAWAAGIEFGRKCGAAERDAMQGRTDEVLSRLDIVQKRLEGILEVLDKARGNGG